MMSNRLVSRPVIRGCNKAVFSASSSHALGMRGMLRGAAALQPSMPAVGAAHRAANRLVARASPLDKLRSALLGATAAPAVVAVKAQEEDLGEMARLADMDTPAGTVDVFGPTAALLVGFMQGEVDHFRSVLDDMGANMVALIPASPAMMGASLQQALEGGPVPYAQPPLGQRRAVILSGMYTTEVMEVIAGYKDAGLPPTVFAAAVPKNYDTPVAEVVESCWKDQMIVQQRATLGTLGESMEDM